jgi:pyruvate formate lyase activating enzyme
MITVPETNSSLKTGIVFDIKQFAVFDGPGVRQTVFLKGCPLRCNWCHNPEGLSVEPQLTIGSGCIHCGACEKVCRNNPCNVCGDCTGVCPLGIRRISGKRFTSAELIRVIRKDAAYYAAYGGGLTFSGGEPLMQSEFLLETLAGFPDVHKAIETSGYADEKTFSTVAAAVDYILIDIKAFDPEVHKKFTGVDNRLILRNIESLFDGNTPFVIRLPVIPGVNDTDENYEAIARFLAPAKRLEKVEFLPYHKTAGAKYSMVGKAYAPMFDVNRGGRVSYRIFTEHGIRSEVL